MGLFAGFEFDPHEPLWVYLALPFLMAIIGYVTKIVAIEMMFRPLEFKGPIKPWLGWQGQVPRHASKMAGIAVDTITDGLLTPEELFDRIDPDELAAVIEEPLTPSAIIESLLTGPMSDKLFELIQDEIQRAVDDQVGISRPFVVLAVGGRNYQEMKRSTAQRVVEEMPKTAYQAEEYAFEALDLRNTIVERMKLLDTDSYENLLRPAFKDDEKVVIAVGATLGFIMGELQVQLITLI